MRSPAERQPQFSGCSAGGDIIVSVALALEYEAFAQTEHRLCRGLSEDEVNVFVDAIIALAEPVRCTFCSGRKLRDPCDEMVLETAINGEADALVTFNAGSWRLPAISE